MVQTGNTSCIAVFGGSGFVGKELVTGALRKGLCVKALYRPGFLPGICWQLNPAPIEFTSIRDKSALDYLPEIYRQLKHPAITTGMKWKVRVNGLFPGV
jgi:hypothetical protein